MSCKVIVYEKKMYCIYATDLEKYGDLYTLPEINVHIDRLSRELFLGKNKVFSLIKKDDTYVLFPVENKEETKIGEGSFGTITSLESQNIVVKTYKDPDFTSDVTKEIAVYSMLKELCVVSYSCLPEYYGFTEEKDHISIYLEKGVETLGKIEDPKLQLEIMWQLLVCMRSISSQGIIHCDLKPENILLTNRNVQIIDFGLMEVEYSNNSPRQKSTTIGSKEYIAPEIMLMKMREQELGKYTNKVDIFVLGEIFLNLHGIKTIPSTTENILDIHGLILLRDLIRLPPSDISNIWGLLDDYTTGKPKQIRNIKKKLSEHKLGEEKTDLIARMLCFNPELRISYEDAVKHPVFKGFKIPPLPPFLNNMPNIPDMGTVWDKKDRKEVFLHIRDICKKFNGVETMALTYQLCDLYMYLDPQKNTREIACICLQIAINLFEAFIMPLHTVVQLVQVKTTDKQLKELLMNLFKITHGKVLMPTIVSYKKNDGEKVSISDVYNFYINPTCYL